VQLIQNKFSEFQLGIEAGSKRFERVDKIATDLVEEENPRSTVILERQEDLRYTTISFACRLTVLLLIMFVKCQFLVRITAIARCSLLLQTE